MTYRELLDSVSFDEIVPFIERYHGWNALALYKIHYDYLRHLIPKLGEETIATVSNGEPDESWPEPHLDAFPLEGDYWEHSLAKELIIEPDVKASLAEIAMCCLWHTSFYGFTEEQMDERFENLDYYAEDLVDSDITRLRAKRVIQAIETDMFQLHIYRKGGIENLEPQRGDGALDIYIPYNWNIKEYQYQDRLRKLLLSEVKAQAQRIFTTRTMHYANRYDIPCERVEMSTRGRYMGCCYADAGMIRYNPWIICTASKTYIDYLVCHELAHFYHQGHGPDFWAIAERLYLGLELNAPTSGQTIRQLRDKFVQNKMLTLLKYWGQPSYLKEFYRK